MSTPTPSVLGTAKAWSPLLDEPLQGPVYFRSNGGKRGLLENSANLCKAKRRANVALVGQNGKRARSRPVVGTSCKKRRKKKHWRHRGR